MTAINHDVVLHRGDTAPVLGMTYLGPDGRPADITGWVFVLSVHTVAEPVDDSTLVYELTGNLSAPLIGEYDFSVPADLAETVEPGTYYYDVQCDLGVGKTRTLAYGTWTITQDRTKRLGTFIVLPRTMVPPESISTAWLSVVDESTTADDVPTVMEISPGVFASTLSPASLKPVTTHTLYVSTSGSDLATGLSPDQALASIWKALQRVAAEPTTIYVESGTYDTLTGWTGNVPTQDVVVIATDDLELPTTPGRVVSQAAPLGLVWSSVGGTAAVYSTPLVAEPAIVVDTRGYLRHGEGSRLPKRVSVAACDVPTGGWYWTAGVLNVRAPDSLTPGDRVLVMKDGQVNGFVNLAGVSLWVSGFSFLGGTSAFTITNCARAVFVDCDFDYGAQVAAGVGGYGLTLSCSAPGADHSVYLFRCRARGATGEYRLASGRGASQSSVRAPAMDTTARTSTTASRRTGRPTSGRSSRSSSAVTTSTIRGRMRRSLVRSR